MLYEFKVVLARLLSESCFKSYTVSLGRSKNSLRVSIDEVIAILCIS